MTYESERDEAAKAFANSGDGDAVAKLSTVDTFQAGADWARDYFCRWRDAENDPPKIDKAVIIIGDCGYGQFKAIGLYRGTHWDEFCGNDCTWICDDIQKWLPLPEVGE